MDFENLDQNSCAEKMNIGRSTFQRIYKSARMKIADSLVNGKHLVIENFSEKNHEKTFPGGNGNGRCRRQGHK